MAYSLPETFVEEIKDQTDIVDIISEYVVLNRKGKNFVGLCPFHAEKTPSFTVNPDAQLFYCFGCGVGGNVFSFLMQYHGLEFIEAAKTLAERAGIQLPAEKSITPVEKERKKEKQNIYEINNLAAKFYQAVLFKTEFGVKGRNYLKDRGIKGEVVKEFKLGFAPQGWEMLCKFLKKKGFEEKEIIAAGVAQKSRNGGVIDRFRNRLIFPICDYRRRVIGFGGRTIGGENPKYLNTPETEIFQKGKILYALDIAASEIRKNDFVIIVEGYTDVLTAFQFGIRNAAASLGTAFTHEHGNLLKRYTTNVVLAFDADAAGTNAALRGMEILMECGCSVRVVSLPEGKDPDDYIREYGRDAFLTAIKRESRSLVEYRLDIVCEGIDTDNIDEKVAAVNEIIPTIVKIRNEIEREAYIELVSDKLGLSKEAIAGEVRKYTRKLQKNGINKDKIEKNRYTRRRASIPSLPKFNGPEQTLVWTVVINPEFIELVDKELGIDSFSKAYLREILNLIKDKVNSKGEETVTPSFLIESVTYDTAKQFLTQLYFKDYFPPCDNFETIKAHINHVKKHRLTKEIENKKKELEEAQEKNDNEAERLCLEEINKLYRLREKI